MFSLTRQICLWVLGFGLIITLLSCKKDTCKLLGTAVYSQDIAQIEDAFKQGANADSCTIYPDKPVLRVALETNNLEVVRAVLTSGADVNITDGEGKTPLFYLPPNREISSLLLAHNADIDHKDKQGQTPLMLISHEDVVDQLIAHTRKINATDHRGRTALIHAIQNSEISKAIKLINHGVKYSVQDDQGHDALHYARIIGDTELINMLESKVPPPPPDPNRKVMTTIQDVTDVYYLSNSKIVIPLDLPPNTVELLVSFRGDNGRLDADYEFVKSIGSGLVDVNEKVSKTLKSFKPVLEKFEDKQSNINLLFGLATLEDAKYWQNKGGVLKVFAGGSDIRYLDKKISVPVDKKLAICMMRTSEGFFASSKSEVYYGVKAIFKPGLGSVSAPRPEDTPVIEQKSVEENEPSFKCNEKIYSGKVGNYYGLQLSSDSDCRSGYENQQKFEKLLGEKVFLIKSKKDDGYKVIFKKCHDKQDAVTHQKTLMKKHKLSTFIVFYPDVQKLK